MYVPLNCVIIDADATNRQELALFLGRFGVNVVAQLPTADNLQGLLNRSDAPQLVMLNLDPQTHEMLRRIGHMPRQFPTISFFLMSQVLDATLLMEAMHLGVREFIPLPMSEEKLTAAIERVAQGMGMGKKARVIHVIPTIGGCGSTTVACNVAASLAKTGAKTVLLDLDLVRGGVGGYFDVRPRYTIADVMDSAEKLDKQLLDNALTMHQNSGLAILSRPELPEDTQRINQPGLTRLISVLGRVFDYVVMDSVMSIDPVYAAAITASDTNLLVMQLNVPSAKNSERFVGVLRRMGVEANKIRLVVNRYVKKGCDIEPDEVERSLGLKISWMVPNDFKNAIAAINFGEPVVLRAPKSEMSMSLNGLAGALSGKTPQK
ncbi:MAG TPA: AAA family ATPase [Tepidisphaeraceae bacterium]|jgi:pilus assembly protein CpaE|nr:AAA family ATPase [Tepidisphaeraceae bacterium]